MSFFSKTQTPAAPTIAQSMFTGLFIIAAAAVTIWLVAKAATALFSMRVDYYSHSTMVQDHQAKAALRAAKEAAAKQAALLETVTAFG